MPLHKPKCLAMYHQQLAYCVAQVGLVASRTDLPIPFWFRRSGALSCLLVPLYAGLGASFFGPALYQPALCLYQLIAVATCGR